MTYKSYMINGEKTMTKLIDKSKLKDRLKYGWANDKFVLNTIDSMPTHDIVPCSECVFWDENSGLTARMCHELKRVTV